MSAVIRNAQPIVCQPDPGRWANVDAWTVWSARVVVNGATVATQPLRTDGSVGPAEYTPVAADRGKTAWCEVTAANGSAATTQRSGGTVRTAGKHLDPAITLSELAPAGSRQLSQPTGYGFTTPPRLVPLSPTLLRSGALKASRAVATTRLGRLGLELRSFETKAWASDQLRGWCGRIRRSYKVSLPPGAVQGFLLCKPVTLTGVSNAWRAITYVSEWDGNRPITTHTLHYSGRVKTSVVSVKSSWRGSYHDQQPTIRRATRAGRIATVATAARVKAQ